LKHAYILRFWKEDNTAPEAESCWRFVLEEVFQDHRRWGFTSLAALVAFLKSELDESANDIFDETN
jgi:hypothetical protein